MFCVLCFVWLVPFVSFVLFAALGFRLGCVSGTFHSVFPHISPRFYVFLCAALFVGIHFACL